MPPSSPRRPRSLAPGAGAPRPSWTRALATGALALWLAGCVVEPRAVIAQPPPPPPAPTETVPVAPGPAYVWVPGHWAWRGPHRGYVWVPGRYLVPAQPGYVWVPGRWAPGPAGWVWVEGHWQVP